MNSIKEMKNIFLFLLLLIGLGGCNAPQPKKTPVDYVNPYMGNISHLLAPTFPTLHLPNSMLRVYPIRANYADDRLDGLPILLPGHRWNHAFALFPFQGNVSTDSLKYEYDRELIKPYYYSVYLDNVNTEIQFAPSHQSAMYSINFLGNETPFVMLKTYNGKLTANGNSISGYQYVEDTETKAYVYLETEQIPIDIQIIGDSSISVANGNKSSVSFKFNDSDRKIKIRYGISLISEEQAKKNLERELKDYDLEALAQKGKDIWNSELEKIEVKGTDDDLTIFYTSLYRTYERMICISEDGKYYSGFDGQIHDDEGIPFYNDDWLWDTYRATHPLRIILSPKEENDMIRSFIRMSEQMENFWFPTFPEVIGDTRRMNSNHGVATILDAYVKGLTDFDLNKAYLSGKKAITEKTLAPWSGKKAGKLEEFYKREGYFPALVPGEKETAPEVDSWERRQPVAVTLGTVYDEWCLSKLAQQLGNEADYLYFSERSFNYRKLFNRKTKFFHPKDEKGNFIEPFDYRFSGGLGARDAYDENNGWVYRWDVQHNIADLIELMGGNTAFVSELERMYTTPLGKPAYEFYATLPDHTGNVGQFSMGNEPSLHIPYLYSYAQEPWRTQKRIRSLLKQWFRNDLMGVPGDEDGGGLSAFVVFSQLGFYPVTPGLPMYVIGSPVFENAKIRLPNGNHFEIRCINYDPENKFIHSAQLNGKEWNKSWFSHETLMKGGVLEFTMGKVPNKSWGATVDAIPPSFEMK